METVYLALDRQLASNTCHPEGVLKEIKASRPDPEGQPRVHERRAARRGDAVRTGALPNFEDESRRFHEGFGSSTIQDSPGSSTATTTGEIGQRQGSSVAFLAVLLAATVFGLTRRGS